MDILLKIVKEKGIFNIINQMKIQLENNTCNNCDRSYNNYKCFDCEKNLCIYCDIKHWINNNDYYICDICLNSKNKPKKYDFCYNCNNYYENLENATCIFCNNKLCPKCYYRICNICEESICNHCISIDCKIANENICWKCYNYGTTNL